MLNSFISVFVIRKPLSNVHWEFRNLYSSSGSVASPSLPCLISAPLYLSLTLPLCFAAHASSPAPLPECLASSQSISTTRSSPMSICLLIRASCSRAQPYAEFLGGLLRFGFGGWGRLEGDIPAIRIQWKLINVWLTPRRSPPTHPPGESWSFALKMTVSFLLTFSLGDAHGTCSQSWETAQLLSVRAEITLLWWWGEKGGWRAAFMDRSVCPKWSIGLSF